MLCPQKCSFNLDFVKNRFHPPPTDFWSVWDTFLKVNTFGTFGTLFCILIHPIFWQKVPKNFWIWLKPHPPTFYQKNPTILIYKKCLKTFCLHFTTVWLRQTVRSSCLSSMFNGIWPEPTNKRFNSAYLQIRVRFSIVDFPAKQKKKVALKKSLRLHTRGGPAAAAEQMY